MLNNGLWAVGFASKIINFELDFGFGFWLIDHQSIRL